MSADTLSFVHRFVPGEGPAGASTLLLLHGTGGDENDLLALGGTLLPGAALLSPRGNVLENGMPRFFRRLAEGVFDIDDLQRRTHELADFIEQASANYSLGTSRVVAVGYSNGANIAASLLLLRPQVLAAAVLFRPMVPFIPTQLPDLTAKRIFIAGGLHDSVVNPEGARRLQELLVEAGAVVRFNWHGGGHELGEDDIVAARDCLDRWQNGTLSLAH